jgi:hypothetical protein
VNGGLGLRLAANARRCEIGYAVLAGVVGVLWVGLVLGGVGRGKKAGGRVVRRKEGEGDSRS